MPATYYEAIKHPDADLWLMAMLEELKVFKKIGLYKEVECPPDHKIVDSKWVFKVKHGPNGMIDKYKARLIVKGSHRSMASTTLTAFAPITSVQKFSSVWLFCLFWKDQDPTSFFFSKQ